MILTTRNLVDYLLARNLITAESVVDGDFLVLDATRRNRNFKVMRKRGPSYFVKQIQNNDQHSRDALKREAACYKLAQTDPEFAALTSLMPQQYEYDANQHILVTELLTGSENLADYHRRLGAFPADTAALLGRTLGQYHQDLAAQLQGSPHHALFAGQPPWILSVHEQTNAVFDTLSGANVQLLEIVRKYPEFHPPLEELRREWRNDSLIHGDMKWENCMISGGSEDTPPSLKIVDWELADIGDADWDVGAIFQAYLCAWLLSIPITEAAPAAQLSDSALFPLEIMQPAIRAFWSAYTNAISADEARRRELLLRSVKYAAARMIQTAFEYMYRSPQLTANMVCVLQVSYNMLQTPSEAIGRLLGIETP